MKLIALTGLPRSGKDTFATRLVERYGFVRRQFSDPLKEAAAILLDRPLSQMRGENGFDREDVLPEWGFSVRWFLQMLGTECMRDTIRRDFWVHRMRNYLVDALAPVVITDCRFDNEVALVHQFGGIVIEIVRPGLTASGHMSDRGVKSDIQIWNGDSVERLCAHADSLILNCDHNAAAKSRPAPEQS